MLRLYDVASTIGTRFTNCTVHAPIVDGNVKPELIDRFTFWEFNSSLRHYHLNTALSNDVIHALERQEVVLSNEFIQMLAIHHDLGRK
jgi:hypothetical protein